MIINNVIIIIMCTKGEKMVFKDYYERLTLDDRLKLRDVFLKKSEMSLITFYQKLRTNNFKKLERDLFESLLKQIEIDD